MLTEDVIECLADRIVEKLDQRERAKEQSAIEARMTHLQARLEQLSAPERLTEVWRLREALGVDPEQLRDRNS